MLRSCPDFTAFRPRLKASTFEEPWWTSWGWLEEMGAEEPAQSSVDGPDTAATRLWLVVRLLRGPGSDLSPGSEGQFGQDVLHVALCGAR